MTVMTEPHRVVIARLSAEFASLSTQLARVSADLTELDRLLAPQPAPPPPVTYWVPPQQISAPPPPPPPPPPSTPQPAPAPTPTPTRPRRDEGWIGKLLAIAGVAVTLIGVVLLLVLAAQAGILRPEIRVTAGAVLAGALVAAGWWLYSRPGGRTGAIALAATGVAAAYMDVIALTTIYGWVVPAAGLLLAAAIGGGGLTLARRWDSEQLGLLVLVPLLILAPLVVDGVTLLLVAFMLALAAASLPVQLGRDWIWLHAARTAAIALPLLVALVAAGRGAGVMWLAGACAIGALLALVSALLLLPSTSNKAGMALLAGAGVLPVLCTGPAVPRAAAALMAAALAVTLLALVVAVPLDAAVRRIWGVLAAAAALVAVVVAFDGRVIGPVLLAMATAVAIAGRQSVTVRAVAIGFGVLGAGNYLFYAPPYRLMYALPTTPAAGASTLVGSVLLVAAVAAVLWSLPRRESAVWAGAAAVAGYAVTTLCVTAGVLAGGTGGGFLAGHMAATICWIALAAALFAYAARRPRSERSLPIGGGLAVVAAAMAKLFLFDLGTLDGMFRVAVFIVVGLVLLGMGAGYARLLERQDQPADQEEKESV
ncbi:putative membrane protein (DUF2339) [Mycolicibacterium phlei]|jgi:uncharacterized membrane protein|nr:hypothetical protein MPHLCCUG_02776 [Mycolicibacterium phlei]STZ18740.1 putative membrane protein (DUF2339) [Mycolicibacterium phlei]VEG09694.1 putative membrane protein (DUF2339) [Mycobacteroides chelonae]